MKPLLLCLLSLLVWSSCQIRWVQYLGPEEVSWKRMPAKRFASTNNSSATTVLPLDLFEADSIIQYKGTARYYYDSICIYVSLKDTLLVQVLDQGLLKGLDFFLHPAGLNWPTLVKTENQNWYGYHLYLRSPRLIPTKRFPHKIKKQQALYQVVEFFFDYEGQPYVNPILFRIILENQLYKCWQQKIPFPEFLEGAQMTYIYQSGIAI